MPSPTPAAIAAVVDGPRPRKRPLPDRCDARAPPAELPAEPRGLAVVDRREPLQEGHGVYDEQDPRTPGHRRGPAERQVEAPDVELVPQVEEERHHAHRDEGRRQERQPASRRGARSAAALHQRGEDHDPGRHAAEEEVDRDLPAPDVELRVDQVAVPRDVDLGHESFPRAYPPQPPPPPPAFFRFGAAPPAAGSAAAAGFTPVMAA